MPYSSDPLWPADISVLWRRPMEFFPTRDQTPSERVNALVRFSMYAAVAVAVFGPSVDPAKALGVGAAIGILITIIAASDTLDSQPESSKAWKRESRSRSGPRGCRLPTKDNPFMNTPPTEFGRSQKACRYEDVKDDIAANFEKGLVREVTDVYKNRASDRQFVTAPVSDSIPDTLAFRNFLFSGTAAGSAACVRDRTGIVRSG